VPLYDYDCADCGERFEILRGVHADPPAQCPLCGGGPIKKAFTTPAIHFKGSGWAKKERRATASPGPSRSSREDGTSKAGREEGASSKGGESGASTKGGGPGASGGDGSSSSSSDKSASGAPATASSSSPDTTGQSGPSHKAG
jgi:putative FmdB family regulatory protein